MSTVFTQMGNIVGTAIETLKNTLVSDISTETTARTNADNTLQANIDSEESSRISADTTLQGNVDTVVTNLATEATLRGNGDTTLQSNIDSVSASLTTETNARTIADTTLQTNIDNINTNVSDMITNVAGETIIHQDIVPVDPTVSLGTLAKPFADVFISESSLYVNGTKVLSENAGTIDISADLDQNIRISTQGAGDIEFFPSALGVIQLKGSVSIPSTKLLLTSDGLPMNFGQGIVVDGNVVSDNVTTLTNRVSSLETLTSSNDLNLDTIQEIVTFIQSNRDDLDSISLDWSALQNVPAMYTEAEVGTITEFDNALATAMA